MTYRQKVYILGADEVHTVNISMGEKGMEKAFKVDVINALERKLGRKAVISQTDWEETKETALKDIYANKLCLYKDVTSEYFTKIMIELLVIKKELEDN